MKKGYGLIIGALAGVIALILYEHSKKAPASSAAQPSSTASPQDQSPADTAAQASSVDQSQAAPVDLSGTFIGPPEPPPSTASQVATTAYDVLTTELSIL